MDDPGIAPLLLQLLGPTSIATAASVWIRQWVASKLRTFDRLVTAAKVDRQWRGLASVRIRLLEDQLDATRRNNHALKNYLAGTVLALEQLADSVNVKINLPEAPRWEAPRQLTSDDVMKLLEADAATPGPEESRT